MELNDFWKELNQNDQPGDVNINNSESYMPVVERILLPLTDRVKMYLHMSYAIVIGWGIFTAFLYGSLQAFLLAFMIEVLFVLLTFNSYRTHHKLKRQTIDVGQQVDKVARKVLHVISSYVRSEKMLAYGASPVAHFLSMALFANLLGYSLEDILNNPIQLLVLIACTIVALAVNVYFVNWFYKKSYQGFILDLEQLIKEIEED